jgi:BMFP domain-containing protein YqiC
MDIGTIKKRLKTRHYRTLHEFISEVQLVWDNCKRYNEQSTVIATQEIHQQALFLEKQTKRYCSKFRVPLPHPSKITKSEEHILEDLKNVTFEEKWKLTESVRKLGQPALEKIVEIVSQNCPEAAEKCDNEKVKIKLDLVSRETFSLLQNIIDEFTSENLPVKRGKVKD